MKSLGISKIYSNPLLRRQLRKSVRLSASKVLLLSIGICIGSVILSVIVLLSRRDVGSVRVVSTLWGLIAITTPPFLAVTAAQLTFREVKLQQFELLHIAPLSNAQLVQGFLASSLYQCRNWLLVAAGTMPILIFLVTYIVTYENLVSCLLTFRGDWDYCQYALPNGAEVIGVFLNFALLLVNFWTIILFAALLGITLAAWWRRPYIPDYVGGFFITILSIMAIMLTSVRPLWERVQNNVLLFFFLLLFIGVSYLTACVNVRRPL